MSRGQYPGLTLHIYVFLPYLLMLLKVLARLANVALLPLESILVHFIALFELGQA